MRDGTFDRDEIRSICLSELVVASDSLIDKIEDMITESFSAGYSFAKNENTLVREAAESLSE
jgi:hypothetical protein